MSGDAYHMTARPRPGRRVRAMRAAFKRAQLSPSDVDYVNAHGTSTPLGDEIEVGAVKRIFGAAADNISMSSTKSAIAPSSGRCRRSRVDLLDPGDAGQCRPADAQLARSVRELPRG